ncbi:MFS transporter [Actinokineospora cianjurensis]|uniref:Putative proline/betaine transporter n=1 Tax=Actinokineospora cianjurensis TaxID=585224 RepID=A0A421B386_9PSEU|nr:MFS transporter [Actinokineospora cianjurensis]RLK58738.1 MHS family alpha-ketoglutarate permease-like MFS transporter [Actinokineospora cianjurensis]
MASAATPGRPHGGALPRDRSRRTPSRRGLVAASLGNALEWFDWNAYAVFSVYFADRFFPSGEPGTAQLQALLVFAVGFLFRPLGGVLLAGFADKHGRRSALTLSVFFMAGGSVLIAGTPTYDDIGVVAPVLLVVARAAQGLSTGGEFAAATTYLVEVAPPRHRAFYSSFAYVTAMLGLLAVTLVDMLLTTVLSHDDLVAWGWRVPFACGALIGVYGLYLRRGLDETEAYLANRDRGVRRPTWEVLRRHPTSGLRVVGFTTGATIAYYMFVVYLPSYARNTLGADTRVVQWTAIIAQLAMIGALPLLGALSDRVGRKPLLVVFAAGYAVGIGPAVALLDDSPWTLGVVMTAGMLLFACYGAVGPIAMAEMFPTQVRTAGIGAPYSVTVALFGGTAPYLSVALAEAGKTYLFTAYVMVLCLISLVAYATARETRGVPL